MIYYQPTYKDAKFILATTDEPRVIWMPGDKAPTVKPTALLGSIEWTYAIITAMVITPPPVIGYETFPTMLKHFKRGIGQAAAGAIPESRFPLFIKPAKVLKHFEARVFASKSELLAFIGDDYAVDYSEPVEFTDEIRTFWRRLDLYDSANQFRGYSAGWKLMAAVGYPQINDEPDYRLAECLGVTDGVVDIWPDNDLPCSTLVIDIGTMNGQQAIVEIGDMFAMGTYGADVEYLRCHKQWVKDLLR